MRSIVFAFLLIHGCIHLMGFVKAFGLAEVSELTLPISRTWGLLWLAAALILVIAGVLWLLKLDSWWIAATIGIILSQILVIVYWQDARFGTIPNLIILTVLVAGFLRHSPPHPISIAEPAPFEERYGDEGTGQSAHIFSPFQIDIDPMERLLLINFENDPDSLYVGFEPQAFDDDINGTGILVIGWRTDGKIDVYHQPGLYPDPEKFDIAGKGLANMLEREMDGAIFEITERGAQAQITFPDLNGRMIKLHLEERSTRTRKPFGLLAPMGQAAEQPSAMPLVLLHDFYFVLRSDTDLSVKIGDRYHEPDSFPLPLDFSRIQFARYSPDPLIAMLNPAFDGELHPMDEPVNNTVTLGETRYELTMNGPVYEIQSFYREYKNRELNVTFSPAFPNVGDLRAGAEASGIFEIAGDPTTGFIRGEYSVQNTDGQISIELIPSGGWIPNEPKLTLRFLYRIVPMFKEWPTTYRWTANLQRTGENPFMMKSSWKRMYDDQSEGTP
ncbi:MAG: hypothetical protein JJU13_18130 [Balneolaceae bacterium]|nr:hypothetical protein [Balneolaceae bacterium]